MLIAGRLGELGKRAAQGNLREMLIEQNFISAMVKLSYVALPTP